MMGYEYMIGLLKNYRRADLRVLNLYIINCSHNKIKIGLEEPVQLFLVEYMEIYLVQ